MPSGSDESLSYCIMLKRLNSHEPSIGPCAQQRPSPAAAHAGARCRTYLFPLKGVLLSRMRAPQGSMEAKMDDASEGRR